MPKSIVVRRREQGAVCLSCGSPDYKMSKSKVFEGGKPDFTCDLCSFTWQYGYDGGIYAELAKEKLCQKV